MPAWIAGHLIELARRALPNECVGVLAGPRAGLVSVVYPLENVANDPTRQYLAEPVGIVRAVKSIRLERLELVAIYHSHPRGPAVPSRTDIELNAWEVPQVILDAVTGEVRAWDLFQGVREVELLKV